MTERTTTDTAELADLLVELGDIAHHYAAYCRDCARRFHRAGEVAGGNHYGWLADSTDRQAGTAIGWARQLRDSHATIVGHWPQSDEGRARWEADCSGPENQVTPFDEVDDDDLVIDGIQVRRGDVVGGLAGPGGTYVVTRLKPDDGRYEGGEQCCHVYALTDDRCENDAGPDGLCTMHSRSNEISEDDRYEAHFADREHDRDDEVRS